ncbi:MAG: hypothetical protein D6753_05770 [Planctomycetota bacterium]|nr:MAG: hypothetical protein D6753_05770 [Planctomycetota bacterium]
MSDLVVRYCLLVSSNVLRKTMPFAVHLKSFAASPWSRAVMVVLLCAWLSGCDRPNLVEVPVPPPPGAENQDDAKDVDQRPPAESLNTVAPGDSWIDPARLPWEAWYLQYVGNRRVGYIHFRVTKGASLLHINRVAHYRVRDGDSSLQYRIELEALEYPNGKLASFTETTTIGDQVNAVKGELTGDVLKITRTSDGETSTERVSWPEGTWGVVGLQAMLMAEPIKPGEEKQARMFVTGADRIVEARLAARQPELTTLPYGPPRELTPVDITLLLDETGTRTRSWIDANGEIYKTITLDGTMASMFRVPADIAQRVADEFRLDLMLQRGVSLSGEIPQPPPERMIYGVDSRVDLFTKIPASPRQQVRSRSALELEIETVGAALVQPSVPASDEELESALAASATITSEDPAVEMLAAKWQDGSASTVSDQILHVASELAQAIEETQFDAAVATAAEVATAGRGDCVEHAVLLCAILRHLDIPARVVSGLAPDADRLTARFFMWCEAWDGEKWLPIDALSGQALSALPIELVRSELPGANPYGPILDVYEMMPQMRQMRIKSAQ